MKISNYKRITLIIIVIKNKTKKINCPQTMFRLSKHFNIVTKFFLLVFGLQCIRSNAETFINVIAIINEMGNYHNFHFD